MKKLLPLLLSAVLLISMLCVGTVGMALRADAASVVSTGRGGDAPAVVADSVTALAGQTVQVALRVQNNPGIVALRASVSYDSSVLTLTNIEGADFADVAFSPLDNNPITVNWVDSIHPDVTEDGVLALLTFAVAEGARAGSYPLTVSIPDPDDVFNYAMETVSMDAVSGGVSVVTYTPGDINGDTKVNIRDLGLFQQYLNGWDVQVIEAAADVNGDNKLNIRDLGTLQQFLNGWDVTLKYGGVDMNTTTTVKRPTATELLEQVPDELDGTKITMLLWWNVGIDDTQKAEAFKDATGIQVKYNTQAMNKYQTNLASMIMAGSPPSTAAIINEWYPTPMTRGLMQPISNTGWDFTDTNTYATSLMDQFGYKGQQYGIAIKGSTMSTFQVMFFNKEILQKCGVTEDPYTLWKAGNWNWDTFLDIAKKCTKPKEGLSGVSVVGSYSWMLSAGQDFVKSDITGLKNNIKSSEVLNAWYWNWDLTYTHKVVDTSFTGQMPFFQGKAAMLGAGSYMMQAAADRTNYVPQNMKSEWSVVPFPSPAGMNVAACDGTVWGFPSKVTGDKLQAAAWYLRYYLDDYNNPDMRDDFYPTDHPECWEVTNWLWDQKIQSYNSVGVLTYGGEYTAYSIQYSLIDEADTKTKLKSNLDKWYSVLDANIAKIESEME